MVGDRRTDAPGLSAPDLAEPEPGPAAHSTDTDWFAIDGYGHVGAFWTGERGRVPWAHQTMWRDQTRIGHLFELLISEPPSSGVRFVDERAFDPDPPRLARFDESRVIESPDGLGEHDDEALIELAEPASAERDVLELFESSWGSLRRLPSERPLLLGEVDVRMLRELWTSLGIVRVRMPYRIEAARIGVFHFDLDDFLPTQAPLGTPLRVEQLSPAARHKLAAVTLPGVDFRHVTWSVQHYPNID